MNPNPTINLTFRYLESDYVRAARAHHASRLHLRIDACVAVVLVGVGSWLWQTPGYHSLGVVCVAGFVLFFLMLLAVFVVIPPLIFRREPKFRDEYSLAFSPEGIHFRTAHLDSQLQWSLYSRALVDAQSYLLYYGTHQFTIIPKRVFHDSGQQQAFDQLLTQHIPQIERRDT